MVELHWRWIISSHWLFWFGKNSVVNRPVVFDAIMRVRTSTGVRPTDFFGAFYMVRANAIFSFDLIIAISLELQVEVHMPLVTFCDPSGQHNGHGTCFIEQRHGVGLRDQAWWQAYRWGWSLYTGERLNRVVILLFDHLCCFLVWRQLG